MSAFRAWIGLCCLMPSAGLALPAYGRLFHGKYGYKVGCNLCHEAGGGSTINDYGRDFLRAGANFQAYARIEQKDSDGDGALSLQEISAKASPGDQRSSPARPGDWLSEAEKVPVPTESLRKLFADAEAFAAIEGTLKEDQVPKVERTVGAKLTDEDKLPTFYFALKGGRRYAVAELVSAPSPKGPLSIAVAMDTKATVTGVRILKNPADKAVEAPGFLAQFAGKRPADPLEVGRDLRPAAGAEALSVELALAVKKAVASIVIVFGK